ncbi:hypothetical protein [Actinacidiphila reveromycinica]|nr:hypothetical protein [Streptomyces sp. SN-593]
MDHTERFESDPDPDGDGARDDTPRGGAEPRPGAGVPGSGVSPFAGGAGGSGGRRPAGAFDAFAAGAPRPGARYDQRRAERPAAPEPASGGADAFPAPGTFTNPPVDDDGLGLAAGAGAVARLRDADSFDAFGTGGSGGRATGSDAAGHGDISDAFGAAPDTGGTDGYGAGHIEGAGGYGAGPRGGDASDGDAQGVDAFGDDAQGVDAFGDDAQGGDAFGGDAFGGGRDGADDGEMAVGRVVGVGSDAPGTPAAGGLDAFDAAAGSSAQGAPGPGAGLVPFGGGEVAGFGDGFGGAPAADAAGPGGLAPADRDLTGPAQGSGFDAFGTFDAFGRSGGAGTGGAARPGGSFDAFAAGAVSGGGSGGGDGDRLPALRPGSAPSLFDATAPVPRVTRPARDPFAPDMVGGSGRTKVERVVTPDYLLTINHVDGTEVVVRPPEEARVPVRRDPAERTARSAGARPTPPPGPPGPELPLLERDEERERVIRLLARGRSIRVTGPSGAGRTALLESVANACGDVAPDGVLWLSGYHRTVADVLQDLYAVVYAGEGYRPSRADLPGLLRPVGAVVVVDDLEFGGAALEELLAAAPECAFLTSATPDVPAPAVESAVEEVFLAGLSRAASLDLLQLAAGRPLAQDERAWAADLWFESEGLPLRFVQAGALLRQRDALRTPVPEPEPGEWDDSVWQKGAPGAGTGDRSTDTGWSAPGPLPSLAESAAPADLLASRLSEAAREALAFAVALDGECPHPSHLPALVGDTHGDAALGELTSVGLAVPVAAHFRLSAGVVAQLAPSLSVDDELSDVQAHTAALHYAWWTGHPSVTPERATAESEAIIAAMTACRDGGHASAAVLLARTVAPAFAAALHWGAWERALRVGQEAARLSGEVAEEAYFLHELGVLALCTGNVDRARADLEASIALRAALADRQGTVVGRRTLALVTDLIGPPAPPAPAQLTAAPFEPQPPATEATLALPEAVPPVFISKGPAPAASPAAGPAAPGLRKLAVSGSRRNLVAAGTGVLIAAVVGTVVTLGATSGGDSHPDNQVKPIESVQQDPPDTSASAPAQDATTDRPSSSGASSASPSTTASTPSATTPAGTATPSGGDASTTPPTTTPTTTGGGHHGGGGGGNPTTSASTPTEPDSPSTSPSSATPTPSGSATTSPPTTPTGSNVSQTASAPSTPSDTPTSTGSVTSSDTPTSTDAPTSTGSATSSDPATGTDAATSGAPTS